MTTETLTLDDIAKMRAWDVPINGDDWAAVLDAAELGLKLRALADEIEPDTGGWQVGEVRTLRQCMKQAERDMAAARKGA